MGGFLLILALCKTLATSVSLGSGSSGGVFSPSLFIGATLGASFASVVAMMLPGAPVSAPAFAMVGMDAMVGGGTGAAMTAVAMIFEMTRDYDIVLPMIIAVAFSLGARGLLSPESIYTLKLVRCGYPIPNALHANMFLVQSAAQVMETDVFVLDEHVPFRDVLAREEGAAFRHVVVTKAHEILGVLRINTGLSRAVSHGAPDITLGALAQRNFIAVQANDVAFGVITRLWKQLAAMAVVVGRQGAHDRARVLGMIAKEHIADAVASSIRIFPVKPKVGLAGTLRGHLTGRGKRTGTTSAKERTMKPTHDLDGLRRRIGKALHLDYLKLFSGGTGIGKPEPVPEWVIVYRAAHGFCCIYRDESVELHEMLDVQIWAEEMDVQTWFIGL